MVPVVWCHVLFAAQQWAHAVLLMLFHALLLRTVVLLLAAAAKWHTPRIPSRQISCNFMAGAVLRWMSGFGLYFNPCWGYSYLWKSARQLQQQKMMEIRLHTFDRIISSFRLLDTE
jgi:hypothetical protein